MEISLFVSSVIVLTYAAENQLWKAFFIVAIFSSIAYAVVLRRKYHPLLQRIQVLEKTQASFAIKAEKYGIINFYNMQDDNEKEERNIINRKIIENGNFFGLLCETGNSYFNPELDRHWPQIKDKLENQDTVQLLIINPNCTSKKLRDSIGEKCAPDLQRLRKLIDQYPSLRVKFTNEVYCSVFFSENEMIYDPYHLGKQNDVIENHLLAIHFIKQNNNDRPCHYQILKEHFNHLWNNGITLNEIYNKS